MKQLSVTCEQEPPHCGCGDVGGVVKLQSWPSGTHPQLDALVAAHVLPAGHGPPQKPDSFGTPHTGDVDVVILVDVVVVVVLVVGGPAGAQRSGGLCGVTVRLPNWSTVATGASVAFGHLRP